MWGVVMKKTLVSIFFIVLICSCMDSSKRVEPVKSIIQVENKTIQVDITSDVKKYEEIVSALTSKIKDDNSPENSLGELWEQEIKQKRESFNCINEVTNKKVQDEFELFITKIDKNIVPYHEHLQKYIYHGIDQTYDLNKKFFESESKHKSFVVDFSPLKLKDRVGVGQLFVTQPALEVNSETKKGTEKNSFILIINYNFIYKHSFSGFKEENLGRDVFQLNFHNLNHKEILEIHQIAKKSVNVIKNIDDIGVIAKNTLWEKRYVNLYRFNQSEREYQRFIREISKKINEKMKIISGVQDESLFCRLFEKDFSIFEQQKDVSITKASTINYKNTDYLNLDLLHLNILNSVNIKLNDSYKISRYLFDKIIRPGLRIFSDVLDTKKTSGIAFNILSSEKNFVSDDDSDFVQYQFYLPKKEVLQYINDDITGQKLADSSYILVNGERIELR